MRIDVSDKVLSKPAWTPKVVTLTFDTEEEARTFRHLVGDCVKVKQDCIYYDRVVGLLNTLENYLDERDFVSII